jgi:hypothetical protein
VIFEHIRAGITLELDAFDAGRRAAPVDRVDREESFSVMRRQIVSMAIAALAVLSSSIGAAPAAPDDAATASAPATVAVQRMAFRFPEIRDEVAMVLVGTLLIGVAAAVRRAA